MRRSLAIPLFILLFDWLVFHKTFTVAAVISMAAYFGFLLMDFSLVRQLYLLHDFTLSFFDNYIAGYCKPLSSSETLQQKCKHCQHSSCIMLQRKNEKSLHRKFTPICKVGQLLDRSIDRFFTLTFENFVTSWYHKINRNDLSLLSELKSHLQYCLNCLSLRLCHLDLTRIIMYKFSRPILDIVNLRIEIQNEDCKLRREVVDQKLMEKLTRSGRLHKALYSRSNEVQYLRDVAQFLLYNNANKEIDWSSPVVIVLREILVSFVLLPVLDLLAEPETLNFLINLAFEPKSDPDFTPELDTENVNLLKSFTTKDRHGHDSFLSVNLNDMLKNQPLLYVFINHMKRINGPIHWLQFFLSLHQLKERISGLLDPVQKPQMDLIRWEIWELYRNYVHQESNDNVDELAPLLKLKFKMAAESADLEVQGVKSVIESTFEAMYYMLQEKYVNGAFLLSPEYMDHVCGQSGDRDDENIGTGVDDSEVDTPKDSVAMAEAVDEFRRTVKSVLGQRNRTSLNRDSISSRSSIDETANATTATETNFSFIEQSLSQSVDAIIGLEKSPAFDSVASEESMDIANADYGAAVKDLSQWSIDLSRVEPRRDSQSKTTYVYVVSVMRRDALGASVASTPKLKFVAGNVTTSVAEGHDDVFDDVTNRAIDLISEQEWKVDRKYQEFYVLETKMVEFHGESILDEQPLPPKKIFNMKSRAFVESMRPSFEKFLHRLLKNKKLRHSELLYTFLTSTDEFTLSFLPNPLQMMRNIPNKFAVERGQNLTPFLDSFQSCADLELLGRRNSPGLKLQKSASMSNSLSRISNNLLVVNETQRRDSQQHQLFKNNCNISSKNLNKRLDEQKHSKENFSPKNSVSMLISFIVSQIFKLPYFLVIILVGFCEPIYRQIYQRLFHLTKNQLDQSITEYRLALAIDLLTDHVYNKDAEKSIITKSRSCHDEILILDKSKIDNATFLQVNNMAMSSSCHAGLEKQDCKVEKWQNVKEFFDQSIIRTKLIGNSEFDQGIREILDLAQCPLLNKHVSYVLLDILLKELFPGP